VKSLTSLWSCTAEELAVRCCTSATRDIKTVASRVEHEGLSFLAITLASLGKAIEKWLDQGFVDPSDCPAFKTGKGSHRGLPAFLSGFLGRVFDPSSGVLCNEPDTETIYALRQLTLMFGKIALPEDPVMVSSSPQNGRKVVSEARERVAMSEYVACEQEVRAADARLDPSYMDEFQRMSAMLFGDLFSKVDRDVYWGRIIPKHGPGAVAEKVSANAKYLQQTWPARLEGIFPFDSYVLPNHHFRGEEGARPHFLEPGAELPVRVCAVPKTLKTPRIIAIEPVAMQYLQQGLYRAILSALQEDGILTRMVGITDQTLNQQMAREGSLSGDLATLDLSEASDRVSNQHVLAMLQDWPLLSAAVQASRSRKADVPGHGIIRFAKFASMGSALCFPIEAMVFLTVIFVGIQRELGTPLSRKKLIKLYSERVRVFGDDIIVPREHVLSVVSELENFGFQVNAGKSFWTGRFRESCGKEYYDGEDVGIVRVRQVLPTQRHNASGVISAVAFRNLAYKAGLWKTTAWMDSYIRKLIHEFPNVTPSSPLLGRESVLGYNYQRLDPNTLSPLTKGYVERSKSPNDILSGVGALTKCLLRKEPLIGSFAIGAQGGRNSDQNQGCDINHLVPSVNDEHLERYGRPKSVSIKLGWRSPFGGAMGKNLDSW